MKSKFHNTLHTSKSSFVPVTSPSTRYKTMTERSLLAATGLALIRKRSLHLRAGYQMSGTTLSSLLEIKAGAELGVSLGDHS